MKTRVYISLLACLALAFSAVAEVTDLALDKSGTLYSLTPEDDTLVLTIKQPDSAATVVTVPQTYADEIVSPLVTYDEFTGTVVMAWQENNYQPESKVMLATYQDGTWFGPAKIAGDPSFWATNPTLMVDRVVTVVEDEDGEEEKTVNDYIHLGWWDGENDHDGGYAIVTSIPLVDGVPVLADRVTQTLRDLIPFGIACNIGSDTSLNQPRLFLDPQTGTVHIFFVDVVDCRFGISQFQVEISEDDEQGLKRRRCISTWRVRYEMAVKPMVAMANSKFNVGHNMSVVMYWDDEDAVAYATLNPNDGWSDVKSLQVGELLDHEQAVDLIRHLADK